MKIAKNDTHQRLYPFQNAHFGLKMQKTMLKTFLQHIAVALCNLCKKLLQKTANIRKNETILEIAKNGHQAKAM